MADNTNQQKREWVWTVVLGAVLAIVLLPVAWLFLLVAVIYALFQLPKRKKTYYESRYGQEVGRKYYTGILSSNEYLFYNAAARRQLPLQYVRQASNGLEYFIFGDTLYLFPNFDIIEYDEEQATWRVMLRADEGEDEECDLTQAYEKLLGQLDSPPTLPAKILLEREILSEVELRRVGLPDCVQLIWSYGKAFDNLDSPFLTVFPQSVKELYDMMLETPDLSGTADLSEDKNTITWHYSENIKITIFCDEKEGYLGIYLVSGEKERCLTHWHPAEVDLYDEVCDMGKRGNVLVIKTTWHGSKVLYMGDKADCPYAPNEKPAFGTQYYIEAK